MTLTSLPDADHEPLRGGPTLRWGVLAPGRIAASFVGSLNKSTDQKVVAVASRSQERAQQFASEHGIDTAYGSYDQLLADDSVDIVYVAAPHNEHARLAHAAIAAGKHVLIEKPIATTVAEARGIADAAAHAGVFAMEAMWSRYLPQATIVAQLLADGALGEPRFVEADFGFLARFDPASRLYNPELAGGALLDLGVYSAWFAHFVLGAPRSVHAVGSLAVTGVDQQSTVTLTYDSDALAVVSSSIIVETPVAARVSGTEALLQFPASFPGPSAFRLAVHGGETLEWRDTSGLNWNEGLCYQAVAAARYVSDGLKQSPLHGLGDSTAVLSVLEQARAQLGAL